MVSCGPDITDWVFWRCGLGFLNALILIHVDIESRRGKKKRLSSNRTQSLGKSPPQTHESCSLSLGCKYSTRCQVHSQRCWNSSWQATALHIFDLAFPKTSAPSSFSLLFSTVCSPPGHTLQYALSSPRHMGRQRQLSVPQTSFPYTKGAKTVWMSQN